MNTEMALSTVAVGEWIDVEPIHCHQRAEKNRLVDKVRLITPDGLVSEVIFKFVPEELDFFFDHRIDHLPGMLEINGMRQLSLAVAHLIYGVPMSYVALLGWLKVMFYSYGDINTDTRAEVRLMRTKFTKFKKEYVMSGVMRQNRKKLIRMDGKLIMMHPDLANKARCFNIDVDSPEVNDAPQFVW